MNAGGWVRNQSTLASDKYRKNLQVYFMQSNKDSDTKIIVVRRKSRRFTKISRFTKKDCHKNPVRVTVHNVLCLVNGKNVLDESYWDDEKIQTQFGTDQFHSVKPKWMVEEFLKPESLSEDEKIPRDWKFPLLWRRNCPNSCCFEKLNCR